MLTDQDWNRIRRYTDQVINREINAVLFQGGAVTRDVDGIHIKLDYLQVDLEPERHAP